MHRAQGTTDSEHCFAVFITEIERVVDNVYAEAPPEVIQACIIRTIHLLDGWAAQLGITEASTLNFAVTDGRTVVASRVHMGVGHPATLYFSSGSEWAELPGRPGVFTMRQADKREHVVIIASERLTNVKVRACGAPRACKRGRGDVGTGVGGLVGGAHQPHRVRAPVHVNHAHAGAASCRLRGRERGRRMSRRDAERAADSFDRGRCSRR